LLDQKYLQLPASPILESEDSILLPFIPKNILQVEVFIYQVIKNNNLNIKEVLAKISKAVYYIFTDIFIQYSTNTELVAAARSNTKSILKSIIARQGL
jgi:hypothetical protein